MGACYSVDFVYRFKDTNNAKRTLNDFISRYKTNFHFNALTGQSLEQENPEELIRIILTGPDPVSYSDEASDEAKGFRKVSSDFNASNKWEILLFDFFKVLAPHLENESSMYIEPDDYYTFRKIINGKIRVEI